MGDLFTSQEIGKLTMANEEKIVGAFVGAACGDALGWPFEGHAKKRPDKRAWRGEFIAWSKTSGGRFRPALEYIGKGEYSDDTQLILATARSLIHTDYWWLQLALVELPFWTSYERGGGGATKRAALGWLGGTPPWHARLSNHLDQYLRAGGNGVAMRILPHCVRGRGHSNFEEVALSIVTDGVITHGHPRALVGALAYGYGLWTLLRKTGTLRFGELVEVVAAGSEIWGALPPVHKNWPDWGDTIASVAPRFMEAWHETVVEMKELISLVQHTINDGALARDEDILRDLGALNSRTNGAGTVTCAAALYFASRYAASPMDGLVYSASAIGADTDTLSSMTGALLGALSGTGWLKHYQSDLQDVDYLKKLGSTLSNESLHSSETRSEPDQVGKRTIANFIEQLESGELGPNLRMPNGMFVRSIKASKPIVSGTRSQNVWRVETEEGATFFFKGDQVSRQAAPDELGKILKSEIETQSSVVGFGISIEVSNLERSRQFYGEGIGMRVSGITERSVRFENSLVVRESLSSRSNALPITLFVSVSNVQEVYMRLSEFRDIRLSELTTKGAAHAFEVRDPDGYVIEVFERPRNEEST